MVKSSKHVLTILSALSKSSSISFEAAFPENCKGVHFVQKDCPSFLLSCNKLAHSFHRGFCEIFLDLSEVLVLVQVLNFL